MSNCIGFYDAAEAMGDWLYNWQTLLAGLLALAGAGLTVCRINQQIRQNESHRREGVRSRQNSARLVLPLALADVSKFCVNAGSEIIKALEYYDNPSIDSAIDSVSDEFYEQRHFPRLSFRNSSKESLRRFSLTLEDQSDLIHLSELVSNIQIFQARYEGLVLNQHTQSHELYRLLADCATIKFLNDEMYSYGRFDEHSPFGIVGKLSNINAWERIQESALGFFLENRRFDDFCKGLDSYLTPMKEGDVSPWLKEVPE